MRSSTALRNHLESTLGARFTANLAWRDRHAHILVPTGIPEIDALTGGLPRGAITEIHGPASSGRTSLLSAILAAATMREEICTLVDAWDAFDPASADAAGVELKNLLWVRCGGNPEHALKAADLLIENGGFGFVALDLGGVPVPIARRVPLASWFRFRRAIENTPTVMLVLERELTVKTCAALTLEMRRERVTWTGERGCSLLLRGARVGAALPDAFAVRKPAASGRVSFAVRAAG